VTEVFKSDKDLAEYFEPIAKQAKNPKAVANWVINNLRAKLSEAESDGRIWNVTVSEENQTPTSCLGFRVEKRVCLSNLSALIELINLVEAKTISNSAAQTVFAEMFTTGKTPAARSCRKRGLAQVSDTAAIENFCDEAIAANPNPVADYKAGKVARLIR